GRYSSRISMFPGRDTCPVRDGVTTRRASPSPSRPKREETDMKVLVVGATGAIGTRLVPQLVARGHEVVGSSRSVDRAAQLRALGATPVILDALDGDAVRRVVAEARPDAIVHQATALAGASDFKHFDRTFATTNRLRTEGTDGLLAAARESGVGRVVAQ